MDEFNCWKVIPLVSKSARLSAESQYLHDVETDRISWTRLITNGLSIFLLVIQERQSDCQTRNKQWCSFIDFAIKLYSLVPSTAAMVESVVLGVLLLILTSIWLPCCNCSIGMWTSICEYVKLQVSGYYHVNTLAGKCHCCCLGNIDSDIKPSLT